MIYISNKKGVIREKNQFFLIFNFNLLKLEVI